MNIFRKPFVLLTLVAALSFTSCSDDSLVGESSAGSDIGGETGYLAFRIKSADTGGMTRVLGNNDEADFSSGSEASGEFAAEYEIVDNIQANRVFFFEADGKYHSSSLLSLEGPSEGSHEGSSHGTSYAEKIYSATVKRTSKRGNENWPEWCLVVLNGRPSRLNALLALAQAGKPADKDKGSFDMQDFLEWVNKDFRDTDAAEEGLTLGLYKYNPTGNNPKYYFTMTNSVFLNKEAGEDNKETYKVVNSTKIGANNLQPTTQKAMENAITVYVERIMSKVQVDFSGYEGAGSTIGQFNGNTDYGFFYTFDNEHEEGSKWLGPEDEKVKPIKLKALVTNWTINAVEYQTKLFKEISDEWSLDDSDDRAGQNNILFNGWNDISHHRSYWAMDVNYKWTPERYPTQYRNAFGGTATPYQTSWQYGQETKEEGGNDILNENYKWALDYKSFNAVTTKRPYKYCLENTFETGYAGSESHKNMIMGSHVLVQARLLTGKADTDQSNGTDEETRVKEAIEKLDKADQNYTDEVKKVLDENIEDKYYYSDRYYDRDNYIKRQLAVLNTSLEENINFSVPYLKMWAEDQSKDRDKLDDDNKFVFNNILGGLWVKQKNENGDDIYKKVVYEVGTKDDGSLKDDCQIAATDVFTIAPAYTVKGDGKVTIALGQNTEYGYEDSMVNLYYLPKNLIDENGQPIVSYDADQNGIIDDNEQGNNTPVQFTRNQLVSLIYGITNVADCYKNGMMYYAVPIQHYIAVGKGEDYVIDYDKIYTGDYGVVRNHWYKFTINAIAKPGIPVHDPNQPIIPNYDMEDRYIGFEVVILPWHIVDNGNVTLGQ